VAQSPVSVIIPAYNEAARIAQTIGEALAFFDARGLPCEIIVSADGDDGTRETARALAAQHREVKVIGQPARRGKGRGIREAIQLATGDIIGFTDADNKTPITEYDNIEPWLRSGHDVVIGSRGLRESRIERPQPLYRRWGSRGFGLFMHACVGLDGIVDTQCGFKFFRGAVARELFRLQQIDGYMFDVEILYLARLLGYRVREVGVRWQDDGDSRSHALTDSFKHGLDLLRIRFSDYSHGSAPAMDVMAAPAGGATK
jgi:dolichyl-phosphate beta-glucosyltransferase